MGSRKVSVCGCFIAAADPRNRRQGSGTARRYGNYPPPSPDGLCDSVQTPKGRRLFRDGILDQLSRPTRNRRTAGRPPHVPGLRAASFTLSVPLQAAVCAAAHTGSLPRCILAGISFVEVSTEHEHMNQVAAANSLLAALPHREYQHLLSHLEPVTLTFGEVLYEPGKPIRHVYFPTDSLVSLLTLVEGHMALEIGLVGREGMLGIPVALGIKDSPVRALVQGTGTALRMTSANFRREHGKSGSLNRELSRYIHERIVQITQTAACNRFHHIEGRLARWLLMTRDRLRSDQFRLTQELLGNMLGVLRVAVTNAAGALQQRNLIRYSRGNISILDGNGLEAASCRCYQVVKDMHDHMQGGHSSLNISPVAAAARRLQPGTDLQGNRGVGVDEVHRQDRELVDAAGVSTAINAGARTTT